MTEIDSFPVFKEIYSNDKNPINDWSYFILYQ